MAAVLLQNYLPTGKIKGVVINCYDALQTFLSNKFVEMFDILVSF